MHYLKNLLILCLWTFACFVFRCTNLSEEGITKKADGIHQRILIVDTHCDTPMRMVRGDFDIGIYHEPGKRGSGRIDLPRMVQGGLDAEFFAIFSPPGKLDSEGYNRAGILADQVIQSLEQMEKDYPALVELARTPEDAYRIEKSGKRAAFIGMENGYPMGEDLSRLSYYYSKGIRYITLCHGKSNQICDSSTDSSQWNGLSPFGYNVIEEMNRLGIMVDVSHISDSSFFDVIRFSRIPVIATHSSCRALCGESRNLSDEMLKALQQNGGVIQICVLSSFLKTDVPDPARTAALDSLRNRYGRWSSIKDEATRREVEEAYDRIFLRYPVVRATVSDLVDHIDHVVRTIGIDHAGIGTDFDGGGGIEGCDDVTEFPNITRELFRRGYSEKEIRKIWGGNVIRVFGEVLRARREIL